MRDVAVGTKRHVTAGRLLMEKLNGGTPGSTRITPTQTFDARYIPFAVSGGSIRLCGSG
jgi:hypothetical protein